MLWADDVAGTRINNIVFWLIVPTVVILLVRIFMGGIGTGGAIYPSLSGSASTLKCLQILLFFSTFSKSGPYVRGYKSR